MRLVLIIVAATVVLAVVVWPAVSRADDLEEYELAKSRYDAGSYEEAASRFAQLLDPSHPKRLKDAKLRQLARPLCAASLVALGRLDAADEVIAATLRTDPTYKPTPDLFPQPVIDRFIKVRGELREELEALERRRFDEERRRELERRRGREAEAARQREIERMAAEERVVSTRSRLVALLPFGVGQFQNGDLATGLVFAVSETLTTASTIVSAAIANDYASVDCRTYVDSETGTRADCAQLQSSFETARTVNWVSFGATVALGLGGIVEAQVSFEPETTEVRKRPLPPKPRVEPSVVARDSGMLFGLRGRF